MPFWPFLLLYSSLLCYPIQSGAQCGLIISTFPYHEDFEANAGGWVAGGTNNDWTWGTPTKPTITVAGSGSKCWITGGLTGSFYNFAQRSYVESPCFDFTNLAHPYIHFKIWWESEQRYDGTNLQYSLNGGNSWTNVGWIDDPVDCLNDNWYNYPAISNLTTLVNIRHGWTGNITPTNGSCLGGNGSGGWVEAKHCMPYLAGQTNVLFRFTFGAGTTCNNYDGVAFDDLYIENAPPVEASFTTACSSADTYIFSDSSTNCPDNWVWDFGDPASGAANTSTLQNPSHTFSAPGNYTITLVAGSECSGNTSATATVKVLGILSNVTPIACNGDNNGAISIQTTPAGGTLEYLWSTVPPQTGTTIANLSPGTYTVSVSENGLCTATATISLAQPAVLEHSSSSVPASCGDANGSAIVMETGGAPPYAYQWSPSGGVGSNATGLLPGNYIVTVTDSRACTDTVHIHIAGLPDVQAIMSATVPVRCFGDQNGSATVSATNGTPPFMYTWSTAGNGLTINGLAPGAYTVTVTDVNLCTAIATTTVTEPSVLQHSTSSNAATCGGFNGSATVLETGGTQPYTFFWLPTGGSNATASGLSSGNYFVTVTDSRGCTDTVQISVGNIGGVQANISTIVSVSCFGGNNGSATLSATGGTPPYFYNWSPIGGNGPSAGGLTAGNYFVTVSDANQCIAALALNITQPLQSIQTTVSTVSDISCAGGEDGRLTLDVSGGMGPYVYAWSPPGGSAATLSGLAAGAYSVTVTDAAGCTNVSGMALPDAIPVITQTHTISVLCHGEATGSIRIDTTFGGAPPYLYALNPSTFAPQPLFSKLPGGNFVLYTQDANGCVSADSFFINDPPLNTVQVGSDTTLQLGDSLLLNAFVAYPGSVVQYVWQPGLGLACDTCVSTFARPFMNTIYSLFVTDSNGCVISDSRTLFIKAASVFIPNVFAPGASNENDRFTVYTSPGAEAVQLLQIYDRWGGLVFEKQHFPPSAASEGWDGKIKGKFAPPGVYTYFCRVRFLGGFSGDYSGSITILR